MKNSADATSIVAFCVIGIVLGTLLELLLKNFNSPIPYTVLLFYVGVFAAVLLNVLNVEMENFLEIGGVSSDLIVYGFFPTLLFSETMQLNWYATRISKVIRKLMSLYVFRHQLTQAFAQAILLAGILKLSSVFIHSDNVRLL